MFIYTMFTHGLNCNSGRNSAIDKHFYFLRLEFLKPAIIIFFADRRFIKSEWLNGTTVVVMSELKIN